jgi:hypothetical protein
MFLSHGNIQLFRLGKGKIILEKYGILQPSETAPRPSESSKLSINRELARKIF